MEDKVQKTCSKQSDFAGHAAMAENCVKELLKHPAMTSRNDLSLDDLVVATGAEDPFIIDLFLPHIFHDAQKEMAQESSTGDSGDLEQKCPGQLLLKHAFFQLKEVQDAKKQVDMKHSNAQDRYIKYKSNLSKQTSKKRKLAEIACNQLLEKDDKVAQDRRLARRNQINRHRKNITKIKKVRSEDNLPEVCCFQKNKKSHVIVV